MQLKEKWNGTLDHPDQPDLDAIKMFVGQVPRTWSEEKDLRELFEQYGAVYEINVLRDRSQTLHRAKVRKGLGFMCICSHAHALSRCQNALVVMAGGSDSLLLQPYLPVQTRLMA